MAGSNYLGRAKYFTPHKRYQAGQQSPEQMRAQIVNLRRARMARGQFRNFGTVKYKGVAKGSFLARSNTAAARAYLMRDIVYQKTHPLNVRYMRYRKNAKLRRPTIYGIVRRRARRISPGASYRTTAWRTYTPPRFASRLHKRGYRFRQTAGWKKRGKRFTPR